VKTDTGDVRFFWIFAIIPAYILGALVLSRVIFIIITSQIYVSEGYIREIAIEKAQTKMMTIEVQVVLCAFDTIFMILLVYLLQTKIENQQFQWSNLGLAINSSSLRYFILGNFLGILFIIITRGTGLLVGSNQLKSMTFEEIFTFDNTKFIILFYLWAILNGFWQELLFRGYLQNRVVEKYNAIGGIIMVTIYFVLVHIIDHPLEIYWVVAMILLFFLISSLFHETQSLYLVGAFHGTINYMDQVIERVGVEWTSKPMSVSWSKDILLLSVILIIYLFIIYHKSNTSIDQSTGKHISIGEEE
jgi:membrane protease YdiL (CAAX protease family)